MELVQGARLADRFKIFGALGAGSLGSVFLASDAEQGEALVALKRIPSSWPHEEADALLRRASEGAQVQHPNLVRLTDCIDKEGFQALCFEFVQGRDLASVMDSEEVTLRECLLILYSVCSAVAALHSKSISGLRLQPSNILISDDGEVKVSDWVLRESDQIATEGDAARTDIRSIGVLARAMLGSCASDAGGGDSRILIERLASRAIGSPVAGNYEDMRDVQRDLRWIIERLESKVLCSATTFLLSAGAYTVALLTGMSYFAAHFISLLR